MRRLQPYEEPLRARRSRDRGSLWLSDPHRQMTLMYRALWLVFISTARHGNNEFRLRNIIGSKVALYNAECVFLCW